SDRVHSDRLDLDKPPTPPSARDEFDIFVVVWLGLFYGIGYCPSTDWHWQVKRARGETGLPNSYVKYYVDRLTGLRWDPRLVDVTVLLIGLAAVLRQKCIGSTLNKKTSQMTTLMC